MKQYTWLLYPFGVIALILISFNLLFGSAGLWGKLTIASKHVQEQSEIANQLRAKLARLQAANPAIEKQNFDYLISILPAQKNLPILLSQITQAASGAGMFIESFKGKVGEVTATESATPAPVDLADTLQLQVVLPTNEFDQLRHMVSLLESNLPLISVQQIKFLDSSTNLIVQGEWAALEKLPAGAEHPISDTTADLLQLRDKLKDFTFLPATSGASLDVGINANPF